MGKKIMDIQELSDHMEFDPRDGNGSERERKNGDMASKIWSCGEFKAATNAKQ